MKEEKLSSIYVDNMDIIYCSVCSSSKRGGDGVKVVNGGIVILAAYTFHFIRVPENLVEDSSNNKKL